MPIDIGTLGQHAFEQRQRFGVSSVVPQLDCQIYEAVTRLAMRGLNTHCRRRGLDRILQSVLGLERHAQVLPDDGAIRA